MIILLTREKTMLERCHIRALDFSNLYKQSSATSLFTCKTSFFFFIHNVNESAISSDDDLHKNKQS